MSDGISARIVFGALLVDTRNLAETLKKHFEQKPPNYGDAESVLDILHWHYTEYTNSDSEEIRNQFDALRKMIFPPKEYD